MYGMFDRTSENLPLVTIQALKSASPSFDSHQRLCKSWSSTRTDWPSEPSSVLDIGSASPTSTLSSSFGGSSSCEGGGFAGGSSTLENEAVAVSNPFGEGAAAASAAAADYGGRFPDCSSLLENNDGSRWDGKEDKNNRFTAEDNGIIAGVLKWSGDIEMGADTSSLWGGRGTYLKGISGVAGDRNPSEEGSSSRITDINSGGNARVMVSTETSHLSVALQQQPRQQQLQEMSRRLGGANSENLVQKIDPFSFAASKGKMYSVSGKQVNNNEIQELKKEIAESSVIALKVVDDSEMQKMEGLSEGCEERNWGMLSSLQCMEGGGADEFNMMMMQQQQQQQDQVCRPEEWLADLQSLSSTDFQLGDAEKVPPLGVEDLESMFPTSPPPPPDHSLMKLLFGEVEDPTLLLHHQQQQPQQQQQQQQQQQLHKTILGLPPLKDSCGIEHQRRQMDLQEAIEAQLSSSGLLCNINSQATLAPLTPYSDTCFPIISSNTVPTANLSSLPSSFSALSSPSLFPFHTTDNSGLLNINRLRPQQYNLPRVNSSISPFTSYDPQLMFSRNAGVLPLSYQPNMSSNFSPGCSGLEQMVTGPPWLPSSSVISSPNTRGNSLPAYSVGQYARVQKVMIDKLRTHHLPFQADAPSFPLSSMPCGQPEFSGQLQKFHGPSQGNELLHTTMPWQLKPEPAWQAAVAKSAEDSFQRVVKQEPQQQQTRSPPARDSRISSLTTGDFKRSESQMLYPLVQRGKASVDEMQFTMVDQLLKAAEAVELGNVPMAQAILARLNQHLFPQGKPLQRAAFYFKEALGKRITGSGASFVPHNNSRKDGESPLDILNKISAYKNFCDFSLLPQFAHFTANQAILEAMEGETNIHLIDFELGLGGQWASFLQEIALRPGGTPQLRITTIGDESIEMQLIRENLYQFARSLNISFDFQVIPVEMLDNLTASMFRVGEREAVAVNFAFGLNRLLLELSCTDSVTAFLQLIKDLSPRVVTVVDMESECDRSSFFKKFVDSLQFYASLFDSLESTTNLSMESMLNIEKFLFAPRITSLVEGRRKEKLPHWHSILMGAGFSPLSFSHTAEVQADCLIQNLQACHRGFNVSKHQGSLLLRWHGRTLVSACAWSC